MQVGEVLSVRADTRLVPVAITAIAGTAEAGQIDVWDLTVLPTHTYFAGDVWVHNY
jgi:hypothetical protein